MPSGNHFIGGGSGNSIYSLGLGCTISGGIHNSAGGTAPEFALGCGAIGGGESNRAHGAYATVPGGFNNLAFGDYSFAAGQHAQAGHNGVFVWADSTGSAFTSTSENQFLIRASGGVGIGTDAPASALHVNGIITATALNPSSDRNAKENFVRVSTADVLERVVELKIECWNYKEDPTAKHIGPTAQDFYAAFAFGSDDKHIATVDADGVALAAIQGLHQTLKDKEARIQLQETRIQALEENVSELKDLVNRLLQTSGGGTQ